MSAECPRLEATTSVNLNLSLPIPLDMSRRDISEILERLSLNHRNSLAEKACAYLQAVESIRAIKNHPSHATLQRISE